MAKAADVKAMKPLSESFDADGEGWLDKLVADEDEPDRATLEHLIKAEHGGKTNADNCVAACWACNSTRGVSRWLPAMRSPSMIGLFATDAVIARALRRSREKGILDGAEMARVFAWMRPNDLVWNYWVNNYLLGADPPAFDILFWNADSTRLPAKLHADFLDLYLRNPLPAAGETRVLGKPIDLKKVRVPTYVLAGITDHIVPWQAAYRSTRIFGGRPQFVLSSSGHIQSIVNPVGNAKAAYFAGGPAGDDPNAWLKGATQSRGSWWEHWAEWLGRHAGERRPAPEKLGSPTHRPGAAAPGRYVLQR